MGDTDESAAHICLGAECQFVVDTGEGLVCSKTGTVVGSVMMASFEYVSSSSRYTMQGGSNPSSSIMKSFENLVVIEAASGGRKAGPQAHGDLHGECFRVVNKLLKHRVEDDSTWREALVARCVDSCGMCLVPGRTGMKYNAKSDYVCLATLYLIREGLVVSGTVVCPKDARLAKDLPSLNALTRFGYSKGKYTKATRVLLHVLDKVMLSKPLHQVRV